MKHCSIRFFALIAVWLVAGCATSDRWTSRPQAPPAPAHRSPAAVEQDQPHLSRRRPLPPGASPRRAESPAGRQPPKRRVPPGVSP